MQVVLIKLDGLRITFPLIIQYICFITNQRPAQLHSATAQQSPQGSSMKGLCAVVGIGTTAVLHSVLNINAYHKNSIINKHDLVS